MKSILYAHLVSTLMLTGLIWTIQLVHYPLFNRVGAGTFRAYEIAHMNAITMLVFPLMLVEVVTGFLLIAQHPPHIPNLWFWVGLALIGLIWFVTVTINLPQHTRLAAGFDEVIHQAMVATNWIRTIAWSLRAALVIYILDLWTQSAA